MACLTIKEEDYIFDASAKMITLKNLEIEQKFIRGIYNLNTANNEAIYTGIGAKGGSVVFSGGHTELTLVYNTVPMADTDQLRIDIALDAFEFVFEHTPTSPTIPFGTLPTINPVLNTDPNVIDTGWIYVDDYFKGGQLLYSLINDVGASGKAYLMNASDPTGSQIFGNTNPIPITALIPLLAGFEFPNKYFRAVLVNDGTVNWTDYIIKSTARQSPPNGLYQSIGAPIPLGTPANVGQAFLVGRDDVNTSVSEVVDIHNGTVTKSLAVHVGNRSSEVASRVPHEISAEGITTSQQLDGSWGTNPLTGNPYAFYCTSYHISAANSNTLDEGLTTLREVNAAGAMKFSLLIEEAASGLGGVRKIANKEWSDSNRPIKFDTAVYFLISMGTIEANLNLYGYLE